MVSRSAHFLPLAAVFAAVFAAGLAGCRSAPEAEPGRLAQPALTIRESYAPGDVVAGPGAAGAASAAEASVVPLVCRLLYLERSLAGDLEPVELAGSFMVDLTGAEPILDAPVLLAGGRVGAGAAAEAWLAAVADGEAGRAREIFTTRPALPRGATYTVEALAFETVEDPLDWLDEFPDRGPIVRAVTYALTAEEGGARLTVGVADLDPDEEETRLEELRESGLTDPGPPPPGERVPLRRETLLLDRVFAPGETMVATLPSPFDEGEGRWFALVIEADPTRPGPERVAAVEAALARVAESHARRTGPISVGEEVELLREQSLAAFERRGSRSALLLLAAETDSLLAEDLALTGPEELVTELSRRLFASELESDDVEPPEVEYVGWRLESAAWRLLCERALASEADAELRAPLYRHAGALAAFPDVVLDALAASADLAGFRARLAEEHLYFLDDPDPSARLRAHDWLRGRELAVEGYDPLAPRPERRAALERAREAREAGAASPEGDR